MSIEQYQVINAMSHPEKSAYYPTEVTMVQDVLTCDCCGGINHSRITHKRDFPIHACHDCGLIFVFPQPDPGNLAQLYSVSEGYFATAETHLSNTSPNKAVALDKLLSEHGVAKGRFLDIGCANGKLAYHMRNLGWDVTGIDLNDGALEIARQHGIEVYHGILEECDFDKASFDAIHLGDIIEHVPSPRALLSLVYELLKPGGIATLVTPNADCSFASSTLALSRLTGVAWVHSEAPHHLYEFRTKTLTRMAVNLGFRVINLSYKGGGSFVYRVGASGYFDSLKRDLKKNGQYQLTTQVIRWLPKLVLVTSIMVPLWIWGSAVDKIFTRGRSIVLAIQRTEIV